MRGNHQEEEPLMKFTPDVAEAYQIQQYTRQANNDEQFELQDSSSYAQGNDKRTTIN